jgi:hypothetical protein
MIIIMKKKKVVRVISILMLTRTTAILLIIDRKIHANLAQHASPICEYTGHRCLHEPHRYVVSPSVL